MEIPKVLVADAVSERGVEALREGGKLEVVVKTGLSEAELLDIIGDFSALVVRSQTKVTSAVLEAAKKLRAVGRAGVGVDNVDVEAATRRGVIVMNTPAGNTISTAEHAFSLMMSLARRIPQADASVKAGKWERKKFEGVELYNKTLGILGMGRIGSELARRALAFGMRVMAYDPYLSTSRARALQIELIEDLDVLLPQCDFISVHMPLTDETRHMIDGRRLALLKKSVRIVNCARGGLIHEGDLAEALRKGEVAGAAIDVFEKEPPPEDLPLRGLDTVVFTPHLGASTAEAQESVGIEIAAAIRAVLLEGEIRNAVNIPSIDAKTLASIQHWLTLCDKLGRFLSQIAPRRAETFKVDFRGKIAEMPTAPLSRTALTGYLQLIGGSDVNQVNALSLADGLGLKMQQTKSPDAGEFSELIELHVEANGQTASVAGTFFGSKPRIVKVNGGFVEVAPVGAVLFLENKDRPGMVGHVGTLLGEHQINIARMTLSRNKAGGRALTLLNLDTVPDAKVIERLLADPDIFEAKVVVF